MKFLIVLLVVAAASAVPHKRAALSELEEIINAINSPSTDPATAAALKDMLHNLLGIDNSPAIVDQPAEIDNSPAIIDQPAEIDNGPALVDQPAEIDNSPAFVDPPVYSPFKAPLVQVVVNVNAGSNDVSVDQVYNPEEHEIIPDPADIVDGTYPEIIPDEAHIIDNLKPELDSENISMDTPMLPDNAAYLPEELN